MGKILTNKQLEAFLRKYYEANYGENEGDKWFESPAANVWIFARSEKLIALKCHILSGEVTETVSPYMEEL